MQLTAHLILFTLFVAKAISIRVMSSLSDASDANPVGVFSYAGGAKQAATQDPFKQVTLCWRFRLERLSREIGGSSRIVVIDGPPHELLWFDAVYPHTFFGFGDGRKVNSKSSYLLQEPEAGEFSIFAPKRWTHVCLAFDAETAQITVVKDGKPLNVNFADPILANVTIDHNFYEGTYLGGCPEGVVGCSIPGGQITDFNIWNVSKTIKELMEWTSCKSREKGNVLNWDESEWELNNFVEEEMDEGGICDPYEPGFVIFPQGDNFTRAARLCAQMHSLMAVVRTEEDLNVMFAMAAKAKENDPDPPTYFWGGYTDEEREGHFVDVVKGDPPLKEPPWRPGEPNGDRIENCVEISYRDPAWNDVHCSRMSFSFCHFERSPSFKLRGLCYGSKFDDEFTWGERLKDRYYFFNGFTDSQLTFDAREEIWTLQSLRKPHVYAQANTPFYPFGNMMWKIFNDTCTVDQPEGVREMELSFNSCNDEEFNCLDGTCVSMNGRCDGNVDCDDRSDELECAIIKLEPSYIKHLPAPAVEGETATVLYTRVALLGVFNVMEVDSRITFQFDLRIRWNDARLTFQNIKEDIGKNTLTVTDKKTMWIPALYFVNTVHKSQTLKDSKAAVGVRRKRGYAPEVNPLQDLHNVQLFDGGQNPLIMSRVYTEEFICTFNMRDYPFDTQTCQMIFVPKMSQTGELLRLEPMQFVNMGPTDLTQYFVKSLSVHNASDGDDQYAGEMAVFRVTLGRRLLNNILTNHLPTFGICLLSFSTNFFRAEYFEAVVTVNLTSLLAITTLFISVSGGLPKTAYIKMIDVWLIANLLIPFLQTILHTAIDASRAERPPSVFIIDEPAASSNKRRARIEQELKARERERRRQYFFAIFTWINLYGLPIAFAIFVLSYFLIGLVLR